MIRIVHLKGFRTLTIVLTGMVTWIIQTWAMTTGRQMTNPIMRWTMELRLQQAPSTGMWVLHQSFPGWFGQHKGQWTRFNRGWWRSLHWKEGGKQETRMCRTEWVIMLSPGFICCLTENFTSINIMGEDWAVAHEYLFMNRSMVGEMHHLAMNLICWRRRATRARRILGSALITCLVSILLKGN